MKFLNLKTFFCSWSFSWSRAYFLPFFLTFLFYFYNFYKFLPPAFLTHLNRLGLERITKTVCRLHYSFRSYFNQPSPPPLLTSHPRQIRLSHTQRWTHQRDCLTFSSYTFTWKSSPDKKNQILRGDNSKIYVEKSNKIRSNFLGKLKICMSNFSNLNKESDRKR